MKLQLVEIVWRDITTIYDGPLPLEGTDLSKLRVRKISYGGKIAKTNTDLLLCHKYRENGKCDYTPIPIGLIEDIRLSKAKMEGVDVKGNRTLPVEIEFWDELGKSKLERATIEGDNNLEKISRVIAYVYGVIVKEDKDRVILYYEFDNEEADFYSILKRDIVETRGR